MDVNIALLCLRGLGWDFSQMKLLASRIIFFNKTKPNAYLHLERWGAEIIRVKRMHALACYCSLVGSLSFKQENKQISRVRPKLIHYSLYSQFKAMFSA